jgi:branched-chain amino acid transport system ATP-binding protein
MLKVKNIVSGYGSIHVLNSTSLSVGDGQIVTIVGANGAGKTTMLKTIAGILKMEEGSITFEGKDLKGLWPHEIVRLGISLVPEGRKIFNELSVEENLRIGAYLRNDRNEIEVDIKQMLELFPPLRKREKQVGGTLSGGEQQMLAIARGLMARPKLLMMDEPSMGLAPVIIDSLFELITNINELGTTILLVEQNANMALNIGDRGYVMEGGMIVMEDTCANLLMSENIQSAYLGMDVTET